MLGRSADFCWVEIPQSSRLLASIRRSLPLDHPCKGCQGQQCPLLSCKSPSHALGAAAKQPPAVRTTPCIESQIRHSVLSDVATPYAGNPHPPEPSLWPQGGDRTCLRGLCTTPQCPQHALPGVTIPLSRRLLLHKRPHCVELLGLRHATGLTGSPCACSSGKVLHCGCKPLR